MSRSDERFLFSGHYYEPSRFPKSNVSEPVYVFTLMEECMSLHTLISAGLLER